MSIELALTKNEYIRIVGCLSHAVNTNMPKEDLDPECFQF